jgi:Zn-dependent M28 family amino/carboxypeptidase
MANEILRNTKKDIDLLTGNITKTEKPNSFSFQAKIKIDVKQNHLTLPTENVLGFVEGTDLKSEVLVVTAHYDHIGKEDGKVFNGADDDGSGTVGVMELAKAFIQAKKEGKGPRRSILFMTVAGEEKGLLGSDYYSRHPVFPLENTIANLNIDMIGRIDKEHDGNPNYIYIIGSNMLSNELHEVNETCNKKFVNLELDYTYNKEDDPNRYYYRSDHYNFAKNNIPVIFYFNGVHEDYHQETDEVSKINFEKMEKITRLIFFTAWELANRNERIKLDPEKIQDKK